MKPRNILAICPERKLLGELKPLITQHLPLTPVAEVSYYPDRSALAEIVGSEPPSLCFLDTTSDVEIALTTLGELIGLSPHTQVVVLLADNDPDLIMRCLRQGATEFLIRPLSVEQMHSVLERLSQASQSAAGNRGGGKVISVIPVKGACGASTLASNLVFQWKRLGFKKILLADLDPCTGIQSFLLKIKSTYSFLDALSRAGTLDSDLWKGLVCPTQGVDVLLSPENPADINQDLPDPSSLIDFCRQTYEHVTIDLNGPHSIWSNSIMSASDEILLVTTNELPALRAAQRVLQSLERIRMDRSKIRLLINRYSPEVGLNQDAIETALRCEVFHVVPSDYEAVQRALVEGKLIASSSSFGKSLIALADRLGGIRPVPEKAKKKDSSWGSLFTSLVSRVNS
ncbi:MAG: AAA family ATPase [Acidobacteriia bacterium]|nr:AAA family ATPase [Terriglobia bacterium]